MLHTLYFAPVHDVTFPDQLQTQKQLQELSAPVCARLQFWSRLLFVTASCGPNIPELVLHTELILDNRQMMLLILNISTPN